MLKDHNRKGGEKRVEAPKRKLARLDLPARLSALPSVCNTRTTVKPSAPAAAAACQEPAFPWTGRVTLTVHRSRSVLISNRRSWLEVSRCDRWMREDANEELNTQRKGYTHVRARLTRRPLVEEAYRTLFWGVGELKV